MTRLKVTLGDATFYSSPISLQLPDGFSGLILTPCDNSRFLILLPPYSSSFPIQPLGDGPNVLIRTVFLLLLSHSQEVIHLPVRYSEVPDSARQVYEGFVTFWAPLTLYFE